jgi:cell division protein ftsX
MKFLRMLGRSFRDALKSTIRNFSLSLASISSITITLVIVALALLASFNVSEFTKEIEKDLTIVVFLERSTTKEQLETTAKNIRKMDNIASLKVIPKQEVKKDISAQSETLGKVLENFKDDSNPLKDTIEIKVNDINEIKKTANAIKQEKNVYAVKYGEGMVDQMVSAFTSIRYVGYGIVITLILVTIFLVINTIKLTISARGREIGIMRLVGASNFTIKTPFIIEGLFLGILGSIIPILFTTYGYIYFYKKYNGHLFSPLIKLIEPNMFVYQVSLIILGIGILVGMIGSSSAVRRYLKI